MVKITQIPPQQIPKQITAYVRVKTMRDRVLAFLNANNENGFDKGIEIQPVATQIIKRIKWSRKVGISVSNMQLFENPQPKKKYKEPIPFTMPVLDKHSKSIEVTRQQIMKTRLVATELISSSKLLLFNEYMAQRAKFFEEHEFRKHIIGTKVNFSFMIGE